MVVWCHRISLTDSKVRQHTKQIVQYESTAEEAGAPTTMSEKYLFRRRFEI